MKNENQKKDKRRPSKSSVDLGLKLFLSVVLIAIIYYFLKPLAESKTGSDQSSDFNTTNSITAQEPTIAENKFEWRTYESKVFGFVIKYPPSLSVNDMGNVGGYIDFIRFEEEPSLKLKDKGIAVGVSTLSLTKEVIKIKNQFIKEGGALLADESQIKFKDYPATRLYYKPEDNSQDEERIVIIVNAGGEYTYSISTVPDQMPKVMEGFNFIKS